LRPLPPTRTANWWGDEAQPFTTAIVAIITSLCLAILWFWWWPRWWWPFTRCPCCARLSLSRRPTAVLPHQRLHQSQKKRRPYPAQVIRA
jgi:hypothetical protein